MSETLDRKPLPYQRRGGGLHGQRLEKKIMKTLFLLMALYGGMPIVPLDAVCKDFFRHLTVEKLMRKVMAGEIALPIVRIEGSQKAARGVHINDLAEYLDRQTEAARRECEQLRKAA